jgi:5,10-methylenetetrahydromethanopterin reductase
VELEGGGRARMSWIGTMHSSKVPVSVAATGPRTIAAGARHAERVDFTVGAEPRRISWAVGEARRATPEGEDALSLGAFVHFAVNTDAAVARDMVRGSAAIFAHYASEGSLGVLLAEDREVVERVGEAYDERTHGLSDAGHAELLPDDFLDRFAVVGDAQTCTRRLRELLALGLERIVMVPGSRDADPALVAESNERFASEVLPALRD